MVGQDIAQGGFEPDASDIDVDLKLKPGEIPQRILNLPEDDPERQRFIRGWQEEQLRHGIDPEYEQRSIFQRIKDRLIQSSRTEKRYLLIIMLYLVGITLIHVYFSQLSDFRKEVAEAVESRGYTLSEGEGLEIVEKISSTFWYPDLNDAMNMVERLPRRASENNKIYENSYIDYITKYNKHFDIEEALQWQSRSYRWMPSPTEG
ncbi:hypothetical protein ACQZV8_09525 [Magnetococcales bacterium HHB-1]